MTRELIEDFAKIVKPFVQKRLLEENFEGMGEQDKAEFGRDFDEILSLAIKGLESSTWIPVTERLPDREEYIANNGRFIVSDGERSYSEYFDIYDKECFGEPTMYGFRVDRAVAAWMPLPEPYNGGE